MLYEALLFIDLLGVNSLWKTADSYTDVKDRMNLFEEIIKLSILPVIDQFSCIPFIYSDSVAILCINQREAVHIGKRIFCDCFLYEKCTQPLYLRGVITNWNNKNTFYNTNTLQLGKAWINEIKLDDDYLKAISIEKSGYKGMRLLIHDNKLSTTQIEEAYTSKYMLTDDFSSGPGIYDVKKLKSEIFYPTKSSNIVDVLWMINSQESMNFIEFFKKLRNISQKRFRNSTKDRYEFEQATWTRLLFENVESILGSLLKSEI